MTCAALLSDETPGECPFVGKQFGAAYMRGIAASSNRTGGFASSATMKHVRVILTSETHRIDQ
eukprot:COSAG01_NODE_7997_length_2958_cov_5.321091_4_plen_63_part_00